MQEVLSFIRSNADGDLLSWPVQTDAARRFGLSLAAVEGCALENGLLPARYQRNRRMITTAQQLELFRSAVAVVGCGGLGGYVIEEMARLGVGRIVAIDPDAFEEHNLNRQLLSSPDSLGMDKVTAAAERVAKINPAVELAAIPEAFGRDNGEGLLNGARVAVDALDSIAVRLELGQVCRELSIPLVHGAIAGWYGHVATIFPGEDALEKIYGCESSAKGVEKGLGNPSFTPAVVASLEAAEVCKILLGCGRPLRRRTLTVDLLEMEFVEVEG